MIVRDRAQIWKNLGEAYNASLLSEHRSLPQRCKCNVHCRRRNITRCSLTCTARTTTYTLRPCNFTLSLKIFLSN